MFPIRLARPDSSYPWGFRLEGGSDLPNPLKIQRVTPNSLAERAGLQPEDIVIRINDSNARHLRHDQAKMEIIRSCNDINMTVQRGESVIENSIHVISHSMPVSVPLSSQPNFNNSPGGGHGLQSGPGAYNSPSQIRSATNQTNYSSPSSGRSPTSQAGYSSPPSWAIGTAHNAIPPPFFGSTVHNINNSAEFRSVSSPKPGRWAAPSQYHDSGFLCGACGEDIHGSFVKVQNRVPMHPHCMVCCYCGISLKNIGYFCIKDRLYCDIHATHA